MTRKALVDYTMSDGTFLPKGTFVSVNADCVHFNDSNYAHAEEFDGFRFCREDDEKAAAAAAAAMAGASEGSVKQQMVTTSVDYVPFGHGKHAWYVPLSVVLFSSCVRDWVLLCSTCLEQPGPLLRCERAEGDDGVSCHTL